MDRRRELGNGGCQEEDEGNTDMSQAMITRAVVDLSEFLGVLCTCCCKQINYGKLHTLQ